ncbi:hypothetical protein G5714_004237 [Onychostoma macrolepis]|uniref:Uncharacterized protein n=1 Tax=Onychostoma macrolepis TaxID=369639 RepID=A0A7J6D4M6_9TELE|nr:hypothetical protein G5714_004237 [Onychostoma macrolepis]
MIRGTTTRQRRGAEKEHYRDSTNEIEAEAGSGNLNARVCGGGNTSDRYVTDASWEAFITSKQGTSPGRSERPYRSANETVEKKRECLLRALCSYLNEDPSSLFKEYLMAVLPRGTSNKLSLASTALMLREVMPPPLQLMLE